MSFDIRQLAVAPISTERDPVIGVLLLDADMRPTLAADGSPWVAGPVTPIDAENALSLEAWWFAQVASDVPRAARFGRIWGISGSGVYYAMAGGAPINGGAGNGIAYPGALLAPGSPNRLGAGYVLDLGTSAEIPYPRLMEAVYQQLQYPSTNVGSVVKQVGSSSDWSAAADGNIVYRRRQRITNGSISSALYLSVFAIDNSPSVSATQFSYALAPGASMVLELEPFTALAVVRAVGASAAYVEYEEWTYGL